MMRPLARSGTLARTDLPREPVWTPTYSRPASTGPKSVETCLPIFQTFGCEYRIPAPVGDDDERRVCCVTNPLGGPLHDAVGRGRAAQRRGNAGHLREGAGDRQRLPAGLLVELVSGRDDRDDEARAERDHDDRKLEQEDLPRQPQPTPQAPPSKSHWRIVRPH